MDIINQWLENLSSLLSQNMWLGLVIALAAGLLTSFTPCALSSIPLIIGYVGGYSDDKKKAFFYSIMFSVGMTITFTIIGVIAALIGRLFLGIMMYWYIALGLLMALMALQTWGVIDILPKNTKIASKRKGAVGAMILGALGAFFASPCSTPVLLAIIAVVSTGQSVLMGALMLLLYSIGHCVILVIAGTSIGWVQEMNKSERFNKISNIIKVAMGFILLLLALVLIYTAIT